jgi:hypothetical protein
MKQLTRDEMRNIAGGDGVQNPGEDECRARSCSKDEDCAACDNNKCKILGALYWCQ